MFDSGKIIIGLIVFIGLFSFPLWKYATGGEVTKKPNLVLPPKADVIECVNTTEYMHSSHMDLLNEWRDEVVRKGKRIYISPSGKKFNMSLTKTCLSCHSNKEQFCDRCHSYMGVDPYCWDCHLENKNPENK